MKFIILVEILQSFFGGGRKIDRFFIFEASNFHAQLTYYPGNPKLFIILKFVWFLGVMFERYCGKGVSRDGK